MPKEITYRAIFLIKKVPFPKGNATSPFRWRQFPAPSLAPSLFRLHNMNWISVCQTFSRKGKRVFLTNQQAPKI